MDIKTRKVTITVVDGINLTPTQWDPKEKGTVGWREHMAKLLNLRVKKLAPTCNPSEFFENLARFADEIGFGEMDTIIEVTERVYNVELIFGEQVAA